MYLFFVFFFGDVNIFNYLFIKFVSFKYFSDYVRIKFNVVLNEWIVLYREFF